MSSRSHWVKWLPFCQWKEATSSWQNASSIVHLLLRWGGTTGMLHTVLHTHLFTGYRYNWAIIMPAELSAASVLISYWDKTTTPSVWITVCSAVVIFINMLGAGSHNQMLSLIRTNQIYQVHTVKPNLFSRKLRFVPMKARLKNIFSSIKVITIVGLIILGIILDLGGTQLPSLSDEIVVLNSMQVVRTVIG